MMTLFQVAFSLGNHLLLDATSPSGRILYGAQEGMCSNLLSTQPWLHAWTHYSCTKNHELWLLLYNQNPSLGNRFRLRFPNTLSLKIHIWPIHCKLLAAHTTAVWTYTQLPHSTLGIATANMQKHTQHTRKHTYTHTTHAHANTHKYTNTHTWYSVENAVCSHLVYWSTSAVHNMPYLLCVSKAALCPVIVIQACTVSGNGPQCFPIFGMFVELVRWGGGVVVPLSLVCRLDQIHCFKWILCSLLNLLYRSYEYLSIELVCRMLTAFSSGGWGGGGHHQFL